MSHEFETGFTSIKPSWHKLENLLDHYPTTEEAFLASGLDWTVRKEVLYYNHNGELKTSPHFGVVRESDGNYLGVCKDRYTLFQNKEAFEWCRPLVESGLYKWESAGSLKQGQTCWGLLTVGEREIIKGDKLKNYLLITWSHDGSKSVMVRPTSIRVVCNNTLTAAKNESGKRDKVRHTQTMQIKLDDVRRFYEEGEEFFAQQESDFQRLLNTEIDTAMLDAYMYGVKGILQMEDGKHSRWNNTEKKLREMIASGASQQKELGIENTLYGAFNATSEFLEHYAPTRGDNEGYSVLFGNRGKQIEQCYDLALEMADGSTKFVPSYLKSGYRQEVEGKAEFARLMSM